MDDCLEQLPSSIEAYLEEAGFSGTEIIILRKLLEGDALTLRELAAKTGKSTGVLDQATKKLIKKRIIAREMVNDASRYVLKSLQPVMEWMEDDMQQKHAMIVRRHQNFEAFITSLQVGKKRPEMEYFEGIEGLKKAYNLLLNRGNDFVQYGPTLYLAEEDPLRDFRVQHFRERHRRGIYARVITHNTVLGRRFQSRDPYEYRKTILVDEETYPFHFEKIIVGDTVACFQLKEEQACFIRYPELAEEERVFFERLWNKKVSYEEQGTPQKSTPPLPEVPASMRVIDVPLKTRTFSQLRQFFLSKASIVSFLIFALIAASAGYGVYRHNLAISTIRIQERVKSIAATGAIQFDPADLEVLRTLKDVERPEYRKVVYQLNEIRRQNEGVVYAYIMRPTDNPMTWEFVADADSLEPSIATDVNQDGMLDEQDEKNFPGMQYDVASSNPPVSNSLIEPTAFAPEIDQWGTVIAGWAPIRDNNGVSIAVLGIDVFAEEAEHLTGNPFLPIFTFIGLFLLFIIVRLAAFNRSLFQELCEIFRIRKAVVTAAFCALLSLGLTGYLYVRHAAQTTDLLRERVLSIVTTGALQFNAEELMPLRTLADTQSDAYKDIVRRLQGIQQRNADIKYAYILRPTSERTTWEFVAASDAMDPTVTVDSNGDGIINDIDELVYPGFLYDVSDIEILQKDSFDHPMVTEKPYTDQWGTFLTGYAPIYDAGGKPYALLATDIDAQEVYKLSAKTFTPLYTFLFFFVLFILFRAPGFSKSLLKQVLQFFRKRSVQALSMSSMFFLQNL